MLLRAHDEDETIDVLECLRLEQEDAALERALLENEAAGAAACERALRDRLESVLEFAI